MNRHILALLILALSLPLFQGQKGCGGAIRFGDEEGIEIQEPAAVLLSIPAEGVDIPHEKPEGGHGPVGIMTSDTPEPEDEGEIQDDGSVAHTPGTPLGFVPHSTQINFSVNTARLAAVSMDHAVMNKFEPHLQKFIDDTGIAMTPKELLGKISELSFSCLMDGPLPDGEAWKPARCKGVLGVASFNEDFQLNAEIGDKSPQDSAGLHRVNVHNVAAQIGPRIIAYGSPDLVRAALNSKGTNEKLKGQKRLFEPATLFFSASAPYARALMANAMFSAFRIISSPIEQLSDRDISKMHYVGAMDLINPSIGAAVYQDGETLIRTAASLKLYEDFVDLMEVYSAPARSPADHQGKYHKAVPRAESITTDSGEPHKAEPRISEAKSELAELRTRADELRAVIAGTVELITITRAQRELAEVEARIQGLEKEPSPARDDGGQMHRDVH